MSNVTGVEIVTLLRKLRAADCDPEAAQRLTSYDRAFLAFAAKVTEAVGLIDGQAMREMTGKQIEALHNLKALLRHVEAT